jgi:hypothetical protein
MECQHCGSPVSSTRGEHLYTESGLSNVTLLDIEIRTCDVCGEHEVVVPELEELHRAIARSVATATRPHRLVFVHSGTWIDVVAHV